MTGRLREKKSRVNSEVNDYSGIISHESSDSTISLAIRTIIAVAENGRQYAGVVEGMSQLAIKR